MASIFLSYDHDDARRAAPIASAIEKAGHSVWWDRHIKGGAEYNREIETAVEKADAVVVLWSERSVHSAWVRDEAGEGRDQGKLVPVLIDAVKPPMGFRQFQNIDLSRSRRGPAGSSLRQILDSIDAVGDASRNTTSAPDAKPSRHLGWASRRTAFAALVLAVVAGAALFGWYWISREALPQVAVAASDSTPRSQALSRDLFVKLGTLAHVGASKWQLADTRSGSSNFDLVFRVGETGSAAQPHASLVLIDGKADSVLWSREFSNEHGTVADMRQQLSLTAGRVLGCALEARETSRLPANLLKLFLVGCADEAETSNMEPHKVAAVMRTIVAQRPSFAPAWSRLLSASNAAIGVARAQQSPQESEVADAERAFAEDLRKARRLVPRLPELKLVELDSLSPSDYDGALDLLAQAKAEAPDNAFIWRAEMHSLMNVGRMSDAIASARRAAELDPLSPAAMTALISMLAWGGRIDLAKVELRKAERQWAGTGALRDAQWAFHQRYGDPRIAMTLTDREDAEPYLRARLDPTPANVTVVVEDIRRAFERSDMSEFSYAIQALGEFGKTEEVFDWLDRVPSASLVGRSYILFRPALGDVRRDPRFMASAKRIGLLKYWRESGHWPDFCRDPKLPYDCKEQAAKLGD